MKYISHIFAAASGSMGGTVFSHNRGGAYTRARTTPTNPNTTAQQSARSGFAGLLDRWGNELTEAQRAAWRVYAMDTPVKNALGQDKKLTGQQAYLKGNYTRWQYGEGQIDDAPPTGGFTNVAVSSLSAAVTGDVITCNLYGVPAEQMGMVWYVHPEVIPAGRNFWKGPYTHQGYDQGTFDGSGNNSETITLSSAVPAAVAGDKIAIKVVAFDRNTPRYSTERLQVVVVGA